MDGDQVGHAAFDIGDPLGEVIDEGADVGLDLRVAGPGQALAFALAHVDQLAPAHGQGGQGGQARLHRIRCRARRRPQTLGHERQHPGVDAVGLGKQAEAAGEGAGLTRIDPGGENAGGGKPRDERAFQPAGSLEDDAGRRLRRQACGERLMAFRAIAQAQPAGVSSTDEDDIEGLFSDIDSNGARRYAGHVSALSCGLCNGPCNCSRWKTHSRPEAMLRTASQAPRMRRLPADPPLCIISRRQG